MFLINKHKRLVVVDEDNVPQALIHGCKQVFFDDFYPDIDLTDAKVLIHRGGGGLGDLICLLPAVEALSYKVKELTVAILPQYNSYYNGTFNEVKDLKLFDYSAFSRSYVNIKDDYDHMIDLFCPCGIHESETNYRPTKGRIDNFAEALKVEPRPPKLYATPHSAIKSTKQKILLQLKTNNPAKDWPLVNFQKLAEALVKLGFFVATIDASIRLNNIPCIKDKSLDEIPNYVAAFDMVIGGDSGIMHLASALGVKTFWMFGPTSAELTIPYYVEATALFVKANGGCFSPCYYYKEGNKFRCNNRCGECMQFISVTQVIKEIIQIFDATD